MEKMRSFLSRYRYRLLAVLAGCTLLFLFLPALFANLRMRHIVAREGVLDLSRAPFSLTGPLVPLQGAWELYPGDWPSPAAWSGGTPPVPAGMGGEDIGNVLGRLAGAGTNRVTLRLVVRLEPETRQVALWVPGEIFMPFTLWANGQPIFTNRDRKDARRTVALSYPVHAFADVFAGRLELLMQLELPFPEAAVFFDFPVLGAADFVRRVDGVLGFMRVFLFASLVLMAFYHLALYFFRNRGDRASLFYAAFCLLLSLNGGESHAHLARVIDGLDPLPLHMVAVVAVMFLSLWAYAGFIDAFFPGMVSVRIRRILGRTSLAFALATLACIAGPPGFVLSASLLLSALFLPVVVFSLGYFALVLFRALRHARADVWFILAGSIVLAITILNDVLNDLRLVRTVPFLVPFGIFAFTLAQSLAVSWRFARTLRNEEELARNLERKVEARTAELEEERHRLALQNEAVARDLALARRIQSRFIPAAPLPGIAFWYRPMVEIGGDFFDFVVEQEAVSFLVSDVSGHGVAAAFVTSLVKGFTHEHAALLADPAAFLSRLNDFLGPLTAGNFVTACVCRFERASRTLQLASAGHNPPWLLGNAGAYPCTGGKAGLPLAIMPGNVLEGMGKGYRNESLALPVGNKLLLYTDGLTEAIPFGSDRGNAHGGGDGWRISRRPACQACWPA